MAKREIIEVIPPGTEVMIKKLKVPGDITAVSIRGKGIMYEVSYFNNGLMVSMWAEEWQFELTSNIKPLSIGFKP